MENGKSLPLQVSVMAAFRQMLTTNTLPRGATDLITHAARAGGTSALSKQRLLLLADVKW